MGSILKKYEERFTSGDSFDLFLRVLENTADRLLEKKKVDDVLTKASVIRYKDVDIFRNASAGNCIARIRPQGEKNQKWDWLSFKGPRNEHEGTNLPIDVLNSVPAGWNKKLIKRVKRHIQSYRIKHRNERLVRGKSESSAPQTEPNPRWTPYGVFPPSDEKMKKLIDEETTGLTYTLVKGAQGSIGMRYHNPRSNITGRIVPFKEIPELSQEQPNSVQNNNDNSEVPPTE